MCIMSRIAAPPLQSTDYIIAILKEPTASVRLSITWNPTFTSVHNVTYYRVVITGSSVASCPSRCLPSELCQCTGPVAGENVNINISATNCRDQEGPPLMLVAMPTVPSQPSFCSGVPVYNYTGELTGIDFYWMRVDVSQSLSLRLIHMYLLMLGTCTHKGYSSHFVCVCVCVCVCMLRVCSLVSSLYHKPNLPICFTLVLLHMYIPDLQISIKGSHS